MQQKFPLQNNISYHQINICEGSESLPIIDGYCFIGNKFFYEVCKPEFTDELLNSPGTSPLNINWKAHLSCSRESLPQLWDIVIPVLQFYGCPAFKCVKLSTVSESDLNSLFGKRCVDALQFTIYITPGEEHKYVEILQQLESLLSEEKISRSDKGRNHLFGSDKRIGVYTSVRHSGINGSYLSSEAASIWHKSHRTTPVYNCAGVQDPFEEMECLKKMREVDLQARVQKGPSMWQLALLVQREQSIPQKVVSDGQVSTYLAPNSRGV